MQPTPPDDHPDLQRRAGLARLGALWAAVTVPLVACGGSDDSSPPNIPPGPPPSNPPPSSGPPPSPPPPPPGPAPTGPARFSAVNRSLTDPWGLALLPDGRFLVTQKGGNGNAASMVIVSADGRNISSPLMGVPSVVTDGQGGLLDVVLDPDFNTAGSNWVYFSYSEPGSGGTAGTAVARGRLDLAQNSLVEVTRIFQQLPKRQGVNHFGSRLAFRGDKTLYVTLGERMYNDGNDAQDLTTTLGKVVRINRDGTIPSGNPNMGASAREGIWSYGHRNPQGAAVHPSTGELWISEHGPQGGDEINRTLAGRNYGWPVISWGQQYGTLLQWGTGTSAANMEQPATYWLKEDDSLWTPGTQKSSTAPAGMTFYTGDKFPEWQNNLFVGSLRGMRLWRIVLDSAGTAVLSKEAIFTGQRIRTVRQGADGWMYFITGSGELWRVDRT